MYTTIIYLYYRVPSASPSNNNLTRLPPSLFPTRHLSPDLKVDRANFLRIMLKIGFLIRPLTKNSSFFFPVQGPRCSRGHNWEPGKMQPGGERCGAQRNAARSRRAECQRASFGWQASQSTQPGKGSGRLYSACDWGSLVKVWSSGTGKSDSGGSITRQIDDRP